MEQCFLHFSTVPFPSFQLFNFLPVSPLLNSVLMCILSLLTINHLLINLQSSVSLLRNNHVFIHLFLLVYLYLKGTAILPKNQTTIDFPLCFPEENKHQEHTHRPFISKKEPGDTELFPKILLFIVNTSRKPPTQQEQHYLHTQFPTNQSNFHQQVHQSHYLNDTHVSFRNVLFQNLFYPSLKT